MKLNTTTLPVETSVQNATQAFSIKTTAKAFKILSDGLYKNKILAFVRELSRNAYDAHIAAGRKNIPFEIHLPNMLEPWFHVKDFGTGLSHENVLHLYTTYFESTKQDSNDFVGALGLGSKSPFSYVTSFTVKSRFDGIESTYTCFLSEAGVPSIVKMGEAKYVGHPGLEVVLPIEKNDFIAVKNAVNQDLAFWEGTLPNIVGDSLFKVTPPTRTIIGNNWYITGSRNVYSGYAVAVQGNVGYPIAFDILRQQIKNETERLALDVSKRLNPVVLFDIGKLDVTASREELSYDEPTIRNIITALLKVVEEFGEKFKSEMADVVKETQELQFRTKARDLIMRYQNAYGYEFTSFFTYRFPKIHWNNNEFTLKQLLETEKAFLIEGTTPFGIYHVTRRFRGTSERLKKQIHGAVHVIDNSKNKATLTNFFKEIENRAYGQYRSFSWWDENKNILPRREREAREGFQNFYSNLQKTSNVKPGVFTTWRFNMFNTASNISGTVAKTVIFLNDQKTFGYDILYQYLTENRGDSVFVIDYNKRHVTPVQVASFVKTLSSQLTGLKILSTSQIVLKNPVVKQPRAKRIVTNRNVNEVTKFVQNVTKSVSTMKGKTFCFSSRHDSSLTFEIERVFTEGVVQNVDFMTGDFYYFYERHNKMYLDDAYTRRVDPVSYLNYLNFLKLLPSKVEIVGLKPVHLKKIFASKHKGKILPVHELDKKLFDSIKNNPLLRKAHVVSRSNLSVSSFSEGAISELLQTEEMMKPLLAEYGDYKIGNTGVKLFDELVDLFEVNKVSDNEGLRKVASVLEMIRYYRDGTDRAYINAWDLAFKDVDVTSDVAVLKQKIKNCIDNFYNKYPLLENISVNHYRYDSDRVKKMMKVVAQMVEYVDLKNKKGNK